MNTRNRNRSWSSRRSQFLMRIYLVLSTILLIGGCAPEPDGDAAARRLPHLDAPLDTVAVLESTSDTSTVESASTENLEDPAWLGAGIRGVPDVKDLHFTRYYNAEFSYSIAYPDSLLKPGEPIGENRGLVFGSSNGDVRMMVFAVDGSSREDLDIQYRTALDDPEARVVYRARDDDSYIVSGTIGEEIFYEKSISDGDILKTFRIQYPASRKAYFDAVTAIMSASFESS